jgi:capsular exopolysaccharide synthesis family protein
MNKENIVDTEDEISLLELWSIFKNRFIYFIVTLLIVLAGAFAYLQYTIPKFSSVVTVLVDPIESSSSLDDMLLSGVSSGTSKIQTEVQLITSKRNIQNALESLDLTSYKNSNGESYDTFYKLSGESDSISVNSVQDTNLVTITITDENPKFAADLANALSSSYDNLLTGIAKTSKTTQREFLEEQIPLNETQLQAAADKLSDYKEKSGILQLTEKSSTLVSQIAYFDVKEEPLKLNKINKLDLLSKYAKELASYSIELPTTSELTYSEAFKELKNSYSSANTELLMYNLAYAGELSGTTANSDDLTITSTLVNTKNSMSNKMLDEINKNLFKYSNGDGYVDKILAEYGKATLDVIKDDIELYALEERSKVYNDELDKLPLIERQVTDLERNVTVLQQVGLDLRSMLEQVKLTEAAVSGNVTVIDYAEIPIRPVSPNKLLIMAVAFLLGCALGFFMCIVANLRDNTLNTRDDVKNTVGDSIPLLGWVPLVEKDKSKANKDGAAKSKEFSSITVYSDPTSQRSEKYMSITSNIIYGKTLLNNQIMSITSCDMSSGKTSTISNIAMCLAQMGSRVILVDGDFRMPSILSAFGYSQPDKGCVEVVLGKSKLEDIIVQPIPEVSNLHVLPVGTKPQVPSSILAHPRFSEMLDLLRLHYDYILIDAPPLDYAAEVLSIGKMSDTVLINVRSGITPKDALKELLTDLSAIREKINGVILNGFVPSKNDRGGSANGKYGYGYGYDTYQKNSGEKRKKIVSESKAKREQVKIYKMNINDRMHRDAHFNKLKKYPMVAHNLNFGNYAERFKHEAFKNTNFFDDNEAEDAKRILQKTLEEVESKNDLIEDEINEDFNIDEPSEEKSENSYTSIIESLKNDSDASGKGK